MARKLDRDELLSIIREQRDSALGSGHGSLSNERADALDHYHGRPYGNEVEGRSQVVSKDLAETVDWVMPNLLKIFVASGNIAEFKPIGPEDEEAAQQESDYCNHVIMQDNNGFMVLHDAFKDALLLKNGYVKFWWDTSEKISEEEYTGVTIEDVAMLLQKHQQSGAEVEIAGQEERQIDMGGMLVPVFDIRLKVKTTTQKCVIEPVPAEEIRVSRKCRGSLQDSPYVEHVTTKTRSDLIEMGMPSKFVDNLPALNATENDQEVFARDSVSDESGRYLYPVNDRAMDEIEFCESYIKVDFDGDGVAELRKVVVVSDQIPPGDEWNQPFPCVPIVSFSPKRIPHRHIGESLDDDLADLQEIKTVLLRQMLDNIYITNNQGWLVNERVNLKDFLKSLPGGVKRVKGDMPVEGAAAPVVSVPIIGQILPVIDYMDSLKETRSGVNKATTGLDPDVLKQATKGAVLETMNRASQKIEMIARLLAETGVKELVQQVHGVLLRHQDKPKVIQLRGKYVQVNPAEWRERTDLVVKVGLGTGTEEEKRERLMMIAALQEKVAQVGLIGPQNVYNLFTDITKTLGFDMPEKYILTPGSPEHQQLTQAQQGGGEGEMLANAEAVKGQFLLQKVQFDAQVAQMKEQHKHEMDVLRMQYDSAEAAKERASKEAIEAAKIASREAIESAKMEFKAMLEAMKPVDIGPPGMGTMTVAK